MFTIKSIRVRNFRAIKEANFKPLEKGITGIFGTNGAGKTTFLVATLWALFGERPQGANTAALRRELSDYTEECSVSVVVEHMGQTIEIYRELKGKQNQSLMYIYVDGTEVSHTSIGESEKWVRRKFGITAEGFKTAFVIKQKELDTLVSAKPSDRKSLIEKLAGIDDMTQAVKDARKDENDFKKQLDILPGSQNLYEEAENEYNELFKDNKTTVESFNTSKQNLRKAEQNFETVNNSYMKARDKNSYIDGLTAKHKNKTKEHEDLKERLKVAQQRLNGKTVDNVNALTAELTVLDTELSAKREEYNTLNVIIGTKTNTINSIEKQITTLEEIKEPEKNPHNTEKILQQINKEEINLSSLQEKLTRSQVNLEILNKDNKLFDNGECPTCHREWDNVEETKTHNNQEIQKTEQEIIKTKTLISETVNKIRDLKTNQEESNRIESEHQEYNKTQRKIKELQLTLAEEKESQTPPSKLEDIKKEGLLLAAQRDTKQEELSDAKNALQFLNDVETLETKIKTINIEIPALEKNIKEEKEQAPDLDNIEQELREARYSLEEERKIFDNVSEKVNTYNLKLNSVKHNYEREKTNWEKKKELQDKYQQVAAQTDILERFRQDSVSRLAPELSSYATSFISEMTSGAFTEIILSDEFSPSVVTSVGKERHVSALSGGEESAVALSLRLAISFLISNENPEMLWLDEVLTAQDADRRGNMLSLIRRLPISQVLIINHAQEASDIVDHIVTMVPDLENGSTIKEN